MGIGDVILAESTLSFLGLGIKYPAGFLGKYHQCGQRLLRYDELFIRDGFLAGCRSCSRYLHITLFGDGLRDAFDPKVKR